MLVAIDYATILKSLLLDVGPLWKLMETCGCLELLEKCKLKIESAHRKCKKSQNLHVFSTGIVADYNGFNISPQVDLHRMR